MASQLVVAVPDPKAYKDRFPPLVDLAPFKLFYYKRAHIITGNQSPSVMAQEAEGLSPTDLELADRQLHIPSTPLGLPTHSEAGVPIQGDTGLIWNEPLSDLAHIVWDGPVFDSTQPLGQPECSWHNPCPTPFAEAAGDPPYYGLPYGLPAAHGDVLGMTLDADVFPYNQRSQLSVVDDAALGIASNTDVVPYDYLSKLPMVDHITGGVALRSSTALDQPSIPNLFFPALSLDSQLSNVSFGGDLLAPPNSSLNLSTGLLIPQSFAVTSDPLALCPTPTNQPADIRDLLQVTSRQGIAIDPQDSILNYGPTPQATSSARPENRLRSIRAKPPSTDPGSADGMPLTTSRHSLNVSTSSVSVFSPRAHRSGELATLKRKRSISPYTKRAGIPADSINCFQLDNDVNNYRDGPHRTTRWKRSRKICLRCQDQHLKVSLQSTKDYILRLIQVKCDGVFPCGKCRDYAKHGRRYIDLPCIDADPNEFNYFIGISHWTITFYNEH
jgi:hypothetical protein